MYSIQGVFCKNFFERLGRILGQQVAGWRG
jgi:hypothetical protein